MPRQAAASGFAVTWWCAHLLICSKPGKADRLLTIRKHREEPNDVQENPDCDGRIGVGGPRCGAWPQIGERTQGPRCCCDRDPHVVGLGDRARSELTKANPIERYQELAAAWAQILDDDRSACSTSSPVRRPTSSSARSATRHSGPARRSSAKQIGGKTSSSPPWRMNSATRSRRFAPASSSFAWVAARRRPWNVCAGSWSVRSATWSGSLTTCWIFPASPPARSSCSGSPCR